MTMLLCSCSSRHKDKVEPPIVAVDSPSEDDLLPIPRGASSSSRPYASGDGLLTAPLPVGDSWECLEQLSRPPKPPVTVIKCRQRDSEGRFFFLLAKDYKVAPERRLGVDTIIDEVLPDTYNELFESYSVSSRTVIDHQGAEGRELYIDAVHRSLGPIRKRERLFVRGDHVLIVSAEGLPPLFETFAADIDAWIEGVVFLNLALD